VNCGYYFIDSVEGEWNSGKDEKPTWDTNHAIKKDISLFHLMIHYRI
jgi:hypothetical protein